MKKTEKEYRDHRLIEEYEKGTKIRLIEAMTGLSRQRIYQILEENNVKKRNKLDKKKIPAIIKKTSKVKLYDEHAKPIRR